MSVYNGQDYLSEAIDSILSQTFSDFEFIIINDASTDNTQQILDRYRDRRIRVFTNKNNIGLTKSLNKGIASARGEYLARMDADDLSHSDRLMSQYIFLQNHKDYGLVGTWGVKISSSGEKVGELRYPTSDGNLRKALIRFNPFIHSSIMIRKRVLEKTGLYDESWVFAQDYELYFRLIKYCRIANIPDILVAQRQTKFSITSSKNRQQTIYAIRARSKAIKEGLYPRTAYFYLLRPFLSFILPIYFRKIIKKFI